MRYKIKSWDWIRAAAGSLFDLFVGALIVLGSSFILAILLVIYFKLKGF